jgi:hypothetical protein
VDRKNRQDSLLKILSPGQHLNHQYFLSSEHHHIYFTHGGFGGVLGFFAGLGGFGFLAFFGFGGFFAFFGVGGGWGFCNSKLTVFNKLEPVIAGAKDVRIRKAIARIMVFIGNGFLTWSIQK